jgi:hypothetical protein
MRVPRLRFTTRSMILAVAVAALAMATILGYLGRPFPVSTSVFPADADPLSDRFEIVMHWSDGQVKTIAARGRGGRHLPLSAGEPWAKGRRHYGPLVLIEWSDGTRSYHLKSSRM